MGTRRNTFRGGTTAQGHREVRGAITESITCSAKDANKKKEPEDTARIQRKVSSVESVAACQERAASLRGCVAGPQRSALCPLQ